MDYTIKNSFSCTGCYLFGVRFRFELTANVCYLAVLCILDNFSFDRFVLALSHTMYAKTRTKQLNTKFSAPVVLDSIDSFESYGARTTKSPFFWCSCFLIALGLAIACLAITVAIRNTTALDAVLEIRSRWLKTARAYAVALCVAATVVTSMGVGGACRGREALVCTLHFAGKNGFAIAYQVLAIVSTTVLTTILFEAGFALGDASRHGNYLHNTSLRSVLIAIEVICGIALAGVIFAAISGTKSSSFTTVRRHAAN